MFEGINRPLADNLTALIGKLSGQDAKLWATALGVLLEQEDPWKAKVQLETPISIFPWKKVTIGARSHQFYLDAIHASGRHIEPEFTMKMLRNVPLREREETVTVVRCEGKMFHLCPNYENVVRRMSAYGLTYCHPEVALAIASLPDLAAGGSIVTEGVLLTRSQTGYFKLAWVDMTPWLDSAPTGEKHEMAYANSIFYLCLPNTQ